MFVSAVYVCQEGGNIQHSYGLRLEAALYFVGVGPNVLKISLMVERGADYSCSERRFEPPSVEPPGQRSSWDVFDGI